MAVKPKVKTQPARVNRRLTSLVGCVTRDGKRKSRNTKQGLVHGKKAAFKKAIITLKAGQEIDFYANI